MEQARRIFRRLRAALPENAGRQLDIATISLQDTLQNWRLPAYRVRAALPGGMGESTVVYFGERPQYSSWTHKLFGHAIEPEHIGQATLFQILNKQNQNFTADLTLCPLNPWTTPLFQRRAWRVVPIFVSCKTDLGQPIKDLLSSKGAKEDLRVARRAGYRFEVLKNDAAFDEFFHQMMLPTIKVRHEERAFVSDLENLRKKYRNGFLMAAYVNDEWVAAILNEFERTDTINLANMGWREGDKQWLKQGIVGALINASFSWAQENGYGWVNLGSSHPFANDGPLNFKLKWGATLNAPTLGTADGTVAGVRSFIGLKIDLTSPTAQALLESTPLIELAGGKLRAIGWNAKIPPLFRRQVKQGFEWVNLAEAADVTATALRPPTSLSQTGLPNE